MDGTSLNAAGPKVERSSQSRTNLPANASAKLAKRKGPRTSGVLLLPSMLTRPYRLTRMKDYEILFKEGRFVGGNLVNAKIWRIEPEKYPRRDYMKMDLKIGFVVSTKISKSAVKRNRVKRQMREVVRLLVKAGRIKTGFIIAILAKVNILGKEYNEIEISVMDVLSRGRILIQ